MDDSNMSVSTEDYNKLKKERDRWHNAWYEARTIGGKMYWDGATYGFTKGLSDEGHKPSEEQACDCPRCKKPLSPYGIAERASDAARDISILIDIRRTAHMDVGLEVPEDDALEANLLPLTFVVVRYNTGDEILFQYVNGKRVVKRVKTHDGLFIDLDGNLVRNSQGNLVKNPQTSIFKGPEK
jgi:hypothetical protein